MDLTTFIAPVVKAGLTWLSRRRLPRMDGKLRLDGLQSPVEVLRDRWGVPHIYAENEHDLLFAQGFVHAQDRLWQMEVNRRSTAGRLAEVLGKDAVGIDRRMRSLTMRRVAEREVDLLDTEMRDLLEAYAAGVNVFIARGKLPIEFTVLGYKPEPWVVADSLSWIKMMGLSLCADYRSEIKRARLLDRLGEERFRALYPPYLETWPRIVPPGEPYSVIAEGLPERQHPAPAGSLPSAMGGLGSNNWVVSGKRTTTGMPILANDMHLGMTVPAIWYENHLIGGDLHVTGVTFPGIPGVVSGHNGHVTWGFTDGVPDVQDLYIEHLRRGDDGHVQVEYNDSWVEATVLHEAIDVKDGETVYEDVVVTRHGPIINDARPELADMAPMALRWTSLEPDGMVRCLLQMSHARTCDELRDALRGWTSPVQNVVYADTEGNIGYSFPGKVPIRAKGDGTLPVPGWTDAYEWTGYIPYEHLPHLMNPSQGYVASANNAVVDDGYPYDLAVRPSMGNRAQRIVELIEGQARIDIAYIQQMHVDVVSTLARTVAEAVGQLDVDDPALATIVDKLRAWDGALHVESQEALIYEILIRQMASLVLAETLDDPHPHSSTAWQYLEHALSTGEGFDLGNGETRDDVLRLALAKTVEHLQDELGPDMDSWTWGSIHRMVYGHPLGQNPLMAEVFNRGPYPVPGDGHTVWAAFQGDLANPSIGGPPYRMIVDLGDVRNSISRLTPGQSGHPGSPHYDDQHADWLAGTYHPMLYAREDVEREAVHRLLLDAKSGEKLT